MALLPFLHLIFLGMWGGCVAVELVIEVSGKKIADLTIPVARLHDSIDKYVEIPLVLGVLITGLLQLRPGTLTVLHAAIGSLVVLINFLCFIPVFRRRRLVDENADRTAILQCSNYVVLAFSTGFPLALVALGLGLYLQGIHP